jgi:uncharacterized surface protein with fasciclin (FAS1) repeats
MKAVRMATIGLTAALTSALVAVAPADATEPAAARAGTRSLASVLNADGNRFDRTWGDFDVLDRAVRTVLAAKPDSPVAVLAEGKTRLTAFLPTDRAFRRLVRDLTGTAPATERAVFAAAATLGVDTIEQVLLYHVVPGVTLTSGKVLKADDVELDTAEGGDIRVNIRKAGIFLRDDDTDDQNARVIPSLLDINKGNRQVAHGITEVLRPSNL